MSKTLTKIWYGNPTFDEAVKSGDGKYLTIITTTARELDPSPIKGTLQKVGVINDFCEKYEIIEAQSGANWKDIVDLKYEDGRLRIAQKCGFFSMSMPVVVEWSFSKLKGALFTVLL